MTRERLLSCIDSFTETRGGMFQRPGVVMNRLSLLQSSIEVSYWTSHGSSNTILLTSSQYVVY